MSWRGAPILLTWLLAAVPTLAGAQQCNLTLSAGNAVFCQGSYALCIKAPCAVVPGFKASCSCIVMNGWSMGPAPCTDPGRTQTNPAPGTELMSTYSNAFNPCDQTLSCGNSNWAWCYGAPCTVDAKDKTRATCLCPLCGGPWKTLGGSCHPNACAAIYSAATPANDAFANAHFYNYLKGQGVSVPPPATSCPSFPASPK